MSAGHETPRELAFGVVHCAGGWLEQHILVPSGAWPLGRWVRMIDSRHPGRPPRISRW